MYVCSANKNLAHNVFKIWFRCSHWTIMASCLFRWTLLGYCSALLCITVWTSVSLGLEGQEQHPCCFSHSHALEKSTCREKLAQRYSLDGHFSWIRSEHRGIRSSHWFSFYFKKFSFYLFTVLLIEIHLFSVLKSHFSEAEK